ncbi:hypothetical protein FRC01_002462 [Tulasnella sp. 417]|nr:hypothetical protein FRC01_002462 [Tulasnella sp. 417]
MLVFSSDRHRHPRAMMVDQRNSAQPISQLPPELISHIVALGFPIPSYFGESRKPQPCPYLKILVSLTAISRIWRNAIIGTPSLWGLLSTNQPLRINRISLERSRSCPLMIEIGPFVQPTWTKANELLDVALPHWNRWSHASLWLPNLDQIMAHLSSEAPSLERFHVWTDPAGFPNPTPINLFGGYAPRLWDVWVLGLPIIWDSEGARGLRRLSLQHLHHGVISVDDILSLLTVNPLLESFDIMHSAIGASRLKAPSTRIPPVQLLNLKTIKLQHIPVGVVGNILRCFRAPNCEVFRLQADGKPDNPFDADEFLDQSLGHFNAFLRSTLDFRRSSQLHLYQDHIQWICSSPRIFDAPSFSINISAIKMNSSVPWIAQLLDQGTDHALRLSVFPSLFEIDEEDLAGLESLSLIPHVRTLKMYPGLRQSTQFILDLLGGTNEVTKSSTFPGLEVLQIECISERGLLDLESMLMHRYGEPGRGVMGAGPIRIVVKLPLRDSPGGQSDERIQNDHLVRIRTLPGVESVTLESTFHQDEMLASIYDDDLGDGSNLL